MQLPKNRDSVSWNVELRCSGWWKNPDSRGTERCADTPSCAGQLASRRAHIRQSLCTPASALAGFSRSYETLQNLYFCGACADFGWFLAGLQSWLCGVLCSSAARGQGLLSWAVQAVERCLPFPIFQASPSSWRKPPLFKIFSIDQHLKQINKQGCIISKCLIC